MAFLENMSDSMALVLLNGILAVLVVFLLLRLCARLAVFVGVLTDGGAMKKWLNVMCMSLALLITVILFLMRPSCGPITAERNRSTAFHRAIMAGLEHYHSEFGEYPTPATSRVHLMMDEQDYEVSGALMLYQALTGDGDDHIHTASNGPKASDGVIDASELKNVFVNEVPEQMIRKTEAGFILVDGFGHPFQYTVGGADPMNLTYDLWSFGEGNPVAKSDKVTKQDPAVSAKWIKNW